MDVERKAPDVVHHDDHHADADLDKNQLTEKQLKHGNVGAELVGDGRIELSPEDVSFATRSKCSSFRHIPAWPLRVGRSNRTTGQANQAKDR